MKQNPILEEIRHTRDDLAREAGYDLKRLFEHVRERERQAVARGVKFVSFAETKREEPIGLLREEPPKP